MHDKIKIDLTTGLMIDVVSPNVVGDDIVETPCPDGFYLPKWDGEKWVEGKTAEEIAAIKASVTAPALTEADRITALESTTSTVVDVLADALGVTI